MNIDRCYHIPMSEGQKMCSHVDYQIFLEEVIDAQARYIVELKRRLVHREPRLITPESYTEENNTPSG